MTTIEIRKNEENGIVCVVKQMTLSRRSNIDGSLNAIAQK
jgi:hypothetical protein